MSEATPGVSDIQAPPVTPESLMADPAFMKRVEAKDPKAFEEYNAAYRVARGMPEKPQPAVNEMDVLSQGADRGAAIAGVQADELRDLGFSELAIYEHLNRRPIPLAEHQDAVRKLAQLKTDKAFIERLREGDAAAKRDWRLAHIHITMPVVSNSVDGTLQPEIAAWERAHASTKPR